MIVKQIESNFMKWALTSPFIFNLHSFWLSKLGSHSADRWVIAFVTSGSYAIKKEGKSLSHLLQLPATSLRLADNPQITVDFHLEWLVRGSSVFSAEPQWHVTPYRRGRSECDRYRRSARLTGDVGETCAWQTWHRLLPAKRKLCTCFTVTGYDFSQKMSSHEHPGHMERGEGVDWGLVR